MADEDNFDIDIYGDLDEPASANYKKEDGEDELILDDLDENNTETKNATKAEGNTGNANTNGAGEDTNMGDSTGNDGDSKATNNQSAGGASSNETPQRNTMKRKHPDNRPVDSNATTALYVSDLHWWSTDDDIRGWVNQAECEDELKDITFSEHKVNGKSKGVAFVEFTTPQAATATKNKIESLSSQAGYGSKKHVVTYTSPFNNPFRTLPKDAPARNKGDDNRGGDFKRRDGGDRSHGVGGGGPNFPAPINFQPNNMGGGNMGMGGGGFRGRGGGGMMNRGNMGGGGGGGGFMGSRGPGGPIGGGPGGSPQTGFGMMNQPGMFNNNMGGGGGPGGGGMQFQGGGGGGGGGFQGGRGGMNMGGGMRGGGPGNRGGRGGFQGGMNPGNMPMGQMGGGMGGNMPGGNMGGGMGMGGGNMGGPMGGGMGGNMGSGPNQGGDMGGGFNPMMGGGFNPMMGGGPQFPAPHFNPAFFQGNQSGEQQWNPHGNKRPRQDG